MVGKKISFSLECVKEVGENFIIYERQGVDCEIAPSRVLPCPITEEFLLKNDFKKDENPDYVNFSKDNFSLVACNLKDPFLCFGLKDNQLEYRGSASYIHQLQNIFKNFFNKKLIISDI